MRLLDFESREESLQVGDDQLLQPHEARGSVAAFRWRHRHQLGKRVGYLDPGEALLAARVRHHDGKIQAQVGDMRERPAGVKGERGEDRVHHVPEVGFHDAALTMRQVTVFAHLDAGLRKGRVELTPSVIGVRQQTLTSVRMRSSCSATAPSSAFEAVFCLRTATRTMKNSSMFENRMERNLTRSSRGFSGSCASSRTRC